MSKQGGAPFLVAENTDASFANLAVDATRVYWVTVPPGTPDYLPELDLVRAPKHGGVVEQLASVKGWIAAIGVDDCNLYAVTHDGLTAL